VNSQNSSLPNSSPEPDVKAVQLEKAGGGLGPGDWFPDTRVNTQRRPNSPHLPVGFTMPHLLAHISGERTYGHYLLGSDGTAKVFAFDIDLITTPHGKEPTGTWVETFVFKEGKDVVHEGVDPLVLWRSRDKSAKIARMWYKYQMKMLAHKFCKAILDISDEYKLNMECAAAYSGHKGVHVYGFTGKMEAPAVREAALLVLDTIDEFEPNKGVNFWRHKNPDPIHGFQNFSIEVFPKQVELKEGKLGNLMRLPLGVNHKAPQDPTFFLDMRSPLGQFTPHPNPVELLTKGNPFE
jgi:hypothetical protein